MGILDRFRKKPENEEMDDDYDIPDTQPTTPIELYTQIINPKLGEIYKEITRDMGLSQIEEEYIEIIKDCLIAHHVWEMHGEPYLADYWLRKAEALLMLYRSKKGWQQQLFHQFKHILEKTKKKEKSIFSKGGD